jgi:xanthine/uracil/vitamin C permease (AzgA family)
VNDKTEKIEKADQSRIGRLFDIRLVIGAVLVIYGVILLIVGIADGQAAIAKAAGTRVNLWTGIAMLVVGLLFLLWMRLNPLEVGEPTDREE